MRCVYFGRRSGVVVVVGESSSPEYRVRTPDTRDAAPAATKSGLHREAIDQRKGQRRAKQSATSALIVFAALWWPWKVTSSWMTILFAGAGIQAASASATQRPPMRLAGGSFARELAVRAEAPLARWGAVGRPLVGELRAVIWRNHFIIAATSGTVLGGKRAARRRSK